jgi:hypothetical protein
MEKETKNTKLLNEMYDAVNYLLQNLYDSDQHMDESGKVWADISRVEKALAKLNKGFKLGKE